MLPFFGKVHVAYIPKGKVIGLSKIARLVEIFARPCGAGAHDAPDRRRHQDAIAPQEVGVVMRRATSA